VFSSVKAVERSHFTNGLVLRLEKARQKGDEVFAAL